MPTYVYKFIETGETVEVQQSFSDDTLTELAHPTSGQTMAVKKVFLPVGITFKGGGFYKTDSRGGSGSSSTSSTTSATTTPASSSDGTSSATATPASTPAPSTPAPSTPASS
jgi:predicted nucleic acid-binding Zn ribbon protein